tara:strand:- start:18947 stop:19549 length:603 start_codon:yes stop_codon:yes gene_type:complete
MYEILYTIAILSIIVYIIFTWYNPKLTYVRSKVDNRVYIVRNVENKQNAANLLSKVRLRLDELVEKFVKKFGKSDKRVNLMVKRYSGENIREALPKNGQTSYSVNKGEKIVLCLRAKDINESVIQLNTILFVALHELAHIMSISVGHNEEFWENFRFILSHAIKWKLYKPVKYSENPKKYCGIEITETPLAPKDMGKYLS